MNRSKIEWCDYTINPVKGLCPMACPYCYARRMYKRFKWNPTIEWDESCLESLSKIKEPSRIFIGSTMELFGDWVGFNAINYIINYVKDYPQHTFIFLTKQPTVMSQYIFPDNCWVGVSPITNGQLLLAIGQLERIQAKIKFLSIEPMLNELDAFKFAVKDKCLDWIIIGQRTPVKKDTMPKVEWIKEIVEAADKEWIPVFLKDNLKPLLCSTINGQDIIESHNLWAFKYFKLRQEFPA